MPNKIKELYPEHYDYSFWNKEVDLFSDISEKCDLTLSSALNIKEFNKGDIVYVYDGEYQWTAKVISVDKKSNKIVVVFY